MKHRINGFLSFSSALAGLTLICLSAHPAQGASWVTNGPMTTARFNHTATLLPNGKVLVAGGFIGRSYTNSAELYDPATGAWTPTGSMNVPRIGHTATLLMNGKVLVAGGGDFVLYSSAELYDPATGTWTNTGEMNYGRGLHTATLLPDGRVLVAGGTAQGAAPIAEIYDPASQTWVATGEMNVRRVEHTATLLPSGLVLVAGGLPTHGSVVATNGVEIYDPASGTWMPTNGLNTGRSYHTATLLPNGQVFVAGGDDSSGTALSTAELFNPVTGVWTQTNVLTVARACHMAVLQPNGQLLLAGGNTLTNAEIYDPVTGTSTATGGMTTTHDFGSATLLANGKVLVGGGRQIIETSPLGRGVTIIPTNSTEVYDPTINPATGTNTVTGMMITLRANHKAILLPNGKVLVTGGMNDSSSSFQSAELFSPSNGAWTATGSMTRDRSWGLTLTLLPNGMVLAAGGYAYSSGIYDSELYNPVTGGWTGIWPPSNAGYIEQTATLLPNGKVLVAGGYSQGNGYNLPSAQLFDPGTQTWAVTGPMRTARYGHAATLLSNGKVLVEGGAPIHSRTGAATNSAELYDLVSGTWTNTGAMQAARTGHTATLLPNGKVLVAGGAASDNGAATNSAELYDPVSGTWTNTGAMNVARVYHSATLLPSGKIMVAGGVGTNALVPGEYEGLSSVELYDPATGTWVLTGNLNIPRTGHTASLLANGKVLIAGGFNSNYSYPTDYVSTAELYDAGLGYSNAWQPRITAITSPLNLGSSLVITGAQFRGISEGSSGNTQDSSADYPLVQLRSLESGQTTFLLTTNWSTNSVTSTAVRNFPPGYALATVFVNGIQSTSSIVNISVPVPAMTTLNSPVTLSNGQCQICFTNNPGALFGVLMTSNLSLPLANWTRLGGVVEISPGQFQFTDPQATNAGQRFYNIYAP